jgi:hypothetical protein
MEEFASSPLKQPSARREVGLNVRLQVINNK